MNNQNSFIFFPPSSQKRHQYMENQEQVQQQSGYYLQKKCSGSSSKASKDDQMISSLQTLKSVKRVSLESISGLNLGFEESYRQQSENKPFYASNSYRSGEYQDLKIQKQISSNDFFRFGLSYPTIELCFSKLNINTQKQCVKEEFSKNNDKNHEQKQIKNKSKKVYEGAIELSINNSAPHIFIGGIIINSQKNNKVLNVKSKKRGNQKFKITKEVYKIFKKNGAVCEEDVSIWEQSTGEWIPNFSLSLSLLNHNKSQF